MIDSLGSDNKVITSLRNKITSVMQSSSVSYAFKDHIQIFHYKNPSQSAKGSIGFVNVLTGQAVYTNFTSIQPFDQTSGLALASDYNLGDVYIDESGNIVMSMQAKTNW
jgi:hypothetical protein